MDLVGSHHAPSGAIHPNNDRFHAWVSLGPVQVSDHPVRVRVPCGEGREGLVTRDDHPLDANHGHGVAYA